MTELYDWNPMPHTVSVRCSACGKNAEFEFAEIVEIRLREHVQYFIDSIQFDYQLLQHSHGGRWHAAIYYSGLHGGTSSIVNLPGGYHSDHWNHSKYLYRSPRTDLGSVICLNCSVRCKVRLNWPEDAYFKIEYKHKELWAFNRESTIELRDYIASDERNESSFRWSSFLRHVPSEFKSRKARDAVVKLLNRILESK